MHNDYGCVIDVKARGGDAINSSYESVNACNNPPCS
jgi:hypothetical protein